MKAVFLHALLLLAFALPAQVPSGIAGSFENSSLESVLLQIESTSSYRFYYSKDWIDTVRVTASFQNIPVDEALLRILSGTRLQFYRDGVKIILTQNVPILTGMETSFFLPGNEDAAAQANYSFTREYQGPSVEAGVSKKKVYEIGIKQATVAAGNATVVGYVRDGKSGEPVSGAYVYLLNPSKGTTTDAYGFYSLTIPRGQYTLFAQYTGMKQEARSIILHSDGKLDINMEEDVISLREVVVESDRDANVSNVQMGVTSIDIKSIRNVPKVLGENDILRIAQTLPGVKTLGEGAAGLNVRGGSVDQNLMLINEAPIYNSSHFLGFFSVFNPDAIKTSELYKSGIPVQYGGRLSSIFDMQMKDGNLRKFSGQGGIGVAMARLTVEVPLVKEKTSLMIGGRTTYSDWVLHTLPSSAALRNSQASFYDLVGKLSHSINEKNQLYVSAYYSKDRFKLTTDSTFAYSNALVSLQWRHAFSDKSYGVLSVTNSNYDYSVSNDRVPTEAFNFSFRVNESNAKLDFTNYRGIHKLDYGIQGKHYSLDPGNMEKGSDESLVTPEQIQSQRGLEGALYLADNIEVSPKLSFYLGLRYSHFSALGPGDAYSYQNNAPKDETTITDTTHYSKNEVMKTYHGPEWRMSARYSIKPESSIKLSYNRTRQYIHMLSNTVSVAPTNIWTLSGPNIQPQIADQVSAGYYQNLRDNTLEASIEVYYKEMQHVIDYKIGAQLLLNQNIEMDVLQGNGKAYGFEFMLRKKTGQFNGWLSYTYSRTLLRMSGPTSQETINQGEYFPANYDKPHDLSIVTNYKITRRYSLSMNFAYSTGRPITYPTGLYYLAGAYRINYSDRNQFRIPDYIRLDIGFNIEGNHKIKKLSHNSWNFSIYNVLGRQNPYSIYFVAKDNTVNGYKLSIFGAPIPTITYNFRF